MSKWIMPHVIKLYEAFWVLVDNRLEIIENSKNYIKAKLYSSSWNNY